MQTQLAVLLNGLVLALSASLSQLSFASDVMFYLLLLMLIDLATGLAKTFCVKNRPTSRRFIGGLLSKAAGIIILTTLTICIKGISLLMGASLDIRAILATFLIAALIGEAYSIGRNVISIAYKEDLPEWNAWVFMIREIRLKAEAFFKKFNL